MKNVFILLLMSLAFGKIAQAQAPNWAWAEGAGSAGNDQGKAIKTDPNGNSYVTGRFTATATFGSLSVSSYGGPDIFVAKYNDNGNCVWVRHAGSDTTGMNATLADEGDGIGVDNLGNCYVTGYFTDTAIFDAITLPGNGNREIFVAKYDPAGNVIWARQPTGNISNNYSRAIAVDGSGHSYITGYLGGGSNTFGSFTLNGPGGFVIKYDSSGNVVYATKLGTNGGLDLNSIAIDLTGSAFVTGYLQGSETINSQTYTSAGTRDVATVKLNPNGSVSWFKQGGGLGTPSGNGITTDTHNGIYITGDYDSTIYFNTIVFPQPFPLSRNLFVAKYDSSGNVIWAKASTSSAGLSIARGFAITADLWTNVYFTGTRYSDIHFGTCTLPNNSTQTFIIKIDTAGNCIYSATSGPGNSGAYSYGISLSNSQSANHRCVYITGFSKSRVLFGSDTTAFVGGEDLFVAKLCNTGLLASFTSSDTVFCSETGACINFLDQSSGNPTSWQWHFTGAVPDTSSLQNPTNICYNTPGTYPVSLIVSNGTSYDTLNVSPLIIFGTAPAVPTITVLGGDTLISSFGFSYQWFLNGNAIGGATDSFYVALQGGTYSVQITDITLNCHSISAGVLITSVNFLSDGGVSIYPNPVANKFMVYGLRFTDGALINIFNVLGEVVYSLHPESRYLSGKAETAIDVSSLSNGIYMLKIETVDGMVTKKFVVMHK